MSARGAEEEAGAGDDEEARERGGLGVSRAAGPATREGASGFRQDQTASAIPPTSSGTPAKRKGADR